MAGSYRERKEVSTRLIDKIIENGVSARQSLKKFLGFEEKAAEEVVQEIFSMEDMNMPQLEESTKKEVRKLKKKLQSSTSTSFTDDEAALLLYTHITRKMKKMKNEQDESLDPEKAGEYWTARKNLSKVSEELEELFNPGAVTPSRELLLMEDGEDGKAMADGGRRAEGLAKERKKKILADNRDLRIDPETDNRPQYY